MKVKVEYTVTLDDSFRRAIRAHYGQPGLATREEVKRWYEAHGSSEDDNLGHWVDEEEATSTPPRTGCKRAILPSTMQDPLGGGEG